LKNNSFNLPVSGLQADLSSASAITINNLRQAFQLQRFYERDARGGTRYTEIVRSHFGVVSPDSRLQRSEYLGGSSTPVNISTVVQNSETSKDSPQGNLSAFGIVGTKYSLVCEPSKRFSPLNSFQCLQIRRLGT
jgi:hypothetical protein